MITPVKSPKIYRRSCVNNAGEPSFWSNTSVGLICNSEEDFFASSPSANLVGRSKKDRIQPRGCEDVLRSLFLYLGAAEAASWRRLMKRITIIGGGASGTLLTTNLLMHSGSRRATVSLVEARSRVGRGVAFGTDHDSHLLNVPAGRMGAFPDDVEHFHRWLIANGHSYGANDFVPRKIFGQYLRSVFTNVAEGITEETTLNLVDDEAVDMSVERDFVDVILRSGEILRSDAVVLAFGNFVPPHPSVPDQAFTSSEKYFLDPWNSRVYDEILPDDSIFVVGTGLSMVDVALHFDKHGHRGKIFAISTRGLLPARHELGHTYPSFYHELKSMDRITDMLKAVRRHIAQAEATGSNWRAVIDSLRPFTQQLWIGLPISEKRYFKQHLSRYWNVARHRMPGEAADVIEKMQQDGRLEILKGRLNDIRHVEGKFRVTFCISNSSRTVTADALVNCIGSESNFGKIEKPFVKNLIGRGHIRVDDLAMGISASPDGRVIDKNGEPSRSVYTLGTALKGTLWETTAIPEIRTQARQLALKLLED